MCASTLDTHTTSYCLFASAEIKKTWADKSVHDSWQAEEIWRRNFAVHRNRFCGNVNYESCSYVHHDDIHLAATTLECACGSNGLPYICLFGFFALSLSLSLFKSESESGKRKNSLNLCHLCVDLSWTTVKMKRTHFLNKFGTYRKIISISLKLVPKQWK